MNKVFLYQTAPSTLVCQIRKAAAPALKAFDKDQPVYFKINGNCDKYYPGSNTSPWFLDATLRLFLSEGFKKLVVIEGDLFEFKVETMLKNTYLSDVIKELRVTHLNYENMERDSDMCPKFLNDSQLLNLPVMHTHGFAKISVATKNLWGLLPVTRRKMHRQMYGILLKLYKKYNMFNLVDGTVGMVGDSTRTGVPKRLDLVIAGWDALAVDCACAQIMGFKPEEIPHINMARDAGLIKNYVLAGDFSEKTAPRHDFHYVDSHMRRITRWLEAMESPNFLNSLTSKILKFDPIDFIYQSARVSYNNLMFKRKKNLIYSGDWLEYESCTPYIKFEH